MAYSPASFLSDEPQIWVFFSPADEEAGPEYENAATLQPGQCSWLDRPLASDEPNQLVILAPLLDPTEFSISWSPSKVAVPGLLYLDALQDPEQLQEFSVYNGGQGQFIATAIAPETIPFPSDPAAIPQLAAPEALSSEPEPSPLSSEVLFDDDPRNNQRGQEPYFCSGFASDCEFGACDVDQRVVWGPYCREVDYTYIQPGAYRVVVDGSGAVELGATDYGATGELFAFGSQWATLPAEFTFCWPGRQAGGYGFETLVIAREADASVDHVRIEYLGDDCTGG
jgi:hypothetical protein